MAPQARVKKKSNLGGRHVKREFSFGSFGPHDRLPRRIGGSARVAPAVFLIGAQMAFARTIVQKCHFCDFQGGHFFLMLAVKEANWRAADFLQFQLGATPSSLPLLRRASKRNVPGVLPKMEKIVIRAWFMPQAPFWFIRWKQHVLGRGSPYLWKRFYMFLPQVWLFFDSCLRDHPGRGPAIVSWFMLFFIFCFFLFGCPT